MQAEIVAEQLRNEAARFRGARLVHGLSNQAGSPDG
jgi:hypothetical protein